MGLVLVVALPLWGQDSPSPLAPPQATLQAPLVFRGVTVVDVRDGQRRPDQTVVIVGNRIQALGTEKTLAIPRGARVVDAHGQYLIPGLWDMHVHSQQYADLAYPLYIANGVTGVRDAGSKVPLAMLSRWKREIAAGSRVGPRLVVSGPAIDEAHDSVQTTITYGMNGPDTVAFHIEVPRMLARWVVDSLKAAGADVLKFYTMSRPMRLALAAEARRVGLLFGGHSDDTPGLEFSDSGATFLDHTAWFNPDVCGSKGNELRPEWTTAAQAPACAAAMAQLRRNQTWIVSCHGILGNYLTSLWPTPLELSRLLYYKPDNLGPTFRAFAPARLVELARAQGVLPAGFQAGDTLPPPLPTPTSTAAWREQLAADSGRYKTVAGWLRQRQTPAHENWRRFGVTPPFLAGTDAGIDGLIPVGTPGFQTHDGLMCLTWMDGLTPLEALQTATLNPALALRATDSLGTVEVGKVADLVLLNADPLDDIAHTATIRAVIANGRYYDRAALDRLLADAHTTAKRWP